MRNNWNMPVFDPILLLDCYKFGHIQQYPENTTAVYSNMTARGTRVPGVTHTVNFGLQAFLQHLTDRFDEGFFGQDIDEVCERYESRTTGMLGPNTLGTDHIRALHALGYLPLEFRSLPEGAQVPLRVPMFTVENTDPNFAWLTNYVETLISNETWMPITTATIARRMRLMLDDFALATSDTPEMVDFQAHDFSMRGLTSIDAAAASGAAHLLSFAGTDTVPALDWIEYYYASYEDDPVGLSVPATEHSVMSAGGHLTERETYDRLLDLYPSGIVSVVSDTWDLWNVLTDILPSLKDKIMGRDGKLVIRPDSGDPVDIICGTQIPRSVGPTHDYPAQDRPFGTAKTPEEKGVIELLWDQFGGTYNNKGFKVLDPHVGAIYGDSITYERAQEICRRLMAKGFDTTSVVLGVGSFTYQYVTRDTFNMALKATWAEIDGEGVNLFKDPITDNGTKRSATGRLAVFTDPRDGEYYLIQDASEVAQTSPDNQLKVVWSNGVFTKFTPWGEVLDNMGLRHIR